MDPFDDYPPQPDWSQAACAHSGAGGDEFFPERRGDHLTLARRVCSTCPIQAACLQYALDHDEEGLWAGTTQRQRRAMRRQQEAA